jgi:dolichol-phosphate mannosyltransferase
MDGTDPVRRPRLSLVLPAYNEEDGIRLAVAEADSALSALCEDYEILVVDDGSADRTADEVAAEAARRPHVHLLRLGVNRGYGAALRTGFTAARFDLVAFTDADRQFHLEDLGRLLPLTENAPIAVGYRIDRKDPWRRRFLSGGFNLIIRVLLGTGVRDCDCALKVFRREVLTDLLPETDGYFVNAEMLSKARQLGYTVVQAGVRHRPRLRGASKVSVGNGADAPRSPSPLPALAFLLLVAGLLFFTKLRAPLLEPQEPRYAEIPRQMLQEGNWIVPTLYGEPYLDKPPLLYWLVMASYSLFGVSDQSARLVPGLAGVLTVLTTYLWGRRVAGERAGLCGALVLCLSPGFIYRERMLTFDSVLCLWVVAALAAAHTALASPRLRKGWWLASAAICGLGLLTKGPVALVLVAGPVLALAFLDRRGARLRVRDGLVYLVTAGMVALPWYAAIVYREPRFVVSFFWTHNVVRFLQPFDHEEPFWFYAPWLALGLLPWALLLPGLARFLARRDAATAAQRTPALGFFLLAAAWTVFFFSASGCKRPVYLLPALPTLALALGCYLDVLLPPGLPTVAALWKRGVPRAGGVTLSVLLLGLGVVGAATFKGMVRPASGIALAAAAVAGTGFLVRNWRRASWAGALVATFALLYVGVRELQPAYNRQFALRSDLRKHVALLHDHAAGVACYPQRWDSVSFYLPHSDVKVYHAEDRKRLLADLRSQPETLLLVKSGRVLRELLDDLPESVEYVSRHHQGAVTVGRVRARGPAPDSVFAQLDLAGR